ncbi:hypothetical protein HYX13_05495 [Candidatus Woesearchaeota archaeon]|nr:hypothetical protein [Candidatus Woesearchaeota archaeon]
MALLAGFLALGSARNAQAESAATQAKFGLMMKTYDQRLKKKSVENWKSEDIRALFNSVLPYMESLKDDIVGAVQLKQIEEAEKVVQTLKKFQENVMVPLGGQKLGEKWVLNALDESVELAKIFAFRIIHKYRTGEQHDEAGKDFLKLQELYNKVIVPLGGKGLLSKEFAEIEAVASSEIGIWMKKKDRSFSEVPNGVYRLNTANLSLKVTVAKGNFIVEMLSLNIHGLTKTEFEKGISALKPKSVREAMKIFLLSYLREKHPDVYEVVK